MTTLPDLPGLRDLSSGEQLALVDMAGRLGASPDDIAYVIGFETGPFPFSPAAQNPQSHCTGLIQFCKAAADSFGLTFDELAAMTFLEQLPYVEKYFARYKGRLTSLEDTYLAVFWPTAMGKDDSMVLARQGTDAYSQNALFDRQGRGFFDRGDVVATIRAYAAAHTGRIQVTGSGLDLAGIILLGAVAGVGGAWYFQKHGATLLSRRAGGAWLR